MNESTFILQQPPSFSSACKARPGKSCTLYLKGTLRRQREENPAGSRRFEGGGAVATTVILVRHGETAWNLEQRYQGLNLSLLHISELTGLLIV